jgi:hypothetical protein
LSDVAASKGAEVLVAKFREKPTYLQVVQGPDQAKVLGAPWELLRGILLEATLETKSFGVLVVDRKAMENGVLFAGASLVRHDN